MFLKLFLLLLMLFLNIVDDYYLQGWLTSAKQKSWWEKNAPDILYKDDYIMALCEHAFSWTFMTMLVPSLYLYFTRPLKDIDLIPLYIIIFIWMWGIHCVVDDLKANKKKINLVIDQLIHICQVIFMWIIFIVLA